MYAVDIRIDLEINNSENIRVVFNIILLSCFPNINKYDDQLTMHIRRDIILENLTWLSLFEFIAMTSNTRLLL